MLPVWFLGMWAIFYLCTTTSKGDLGWKWYEITCRSEQLRAPRARSCLSCRQVQNSHKLQGDRDQISSLATKNLEGISSMSTTSTWAEVEGAVGSVWGKTELNTCKLDIFSPVLGERKIHVCSWDLSSSALPSPWVSPWLTHLLVLLQSLPSAPCTSPGSASLSTCQQRQHWAEAAHMHAAQHVCEGAEEDTQRGLGREIRFFSPAENAAAFFRPSNWNQVAKGLWLYSGPYRKPQSALKARGRLAAQCPALCRDSRSILRPDLWALLREASCPFLSRLKETCFRIGPSIIPLMPLSTVFYESIMNRELQK